MSGIIRIKCPECKVWMTRDNKGADMCPKCIVFFISNREEE